MKNTKETIIFQEKLLEGQSIDSDPKIIEALRHAFQEMRESVIDQQKREEKARRRETFHIAVIAIPLFILIIIGAITAGKIIREKLNFFGSTTNELETLLFFILLLPLVIFINKYEAYRKNKK